MLVGEKQGDGLRYGLQVTGYELRVTGHSQNIGDHGFSSKSATRPEADKDVLDQISKIGSPKSQVLEWT